MNARTAEGDCSSTVPSWYDTVRLGDASHPPMSILDRIGQLSAKEHFDILRGLTECCSITIWQHTLSTCLFLVAMRPTANAYSIRNITICLIQYSLSLSESDLQSRHTGMTGSTVVLTCCKGDCQSQWETPIFGPSQPGNPLTDFDKIETDDYVGRATPYAKFGFCTFSGGVSPYR